MNSSPSSLNLEKLCDFPDFFHAYLVKDLRQNLQNPIFIITFLAMGLFQLLIVANLTSTNSQEQIFQNLALPAGILLIVQPLRTLAQFISEPAGKFRETIFLTTMSAGRVVISRWLSIIIQNTLITLILLPCLIFSYFTIGAPIGSILFSLAFLFIFSSILCAQMFYVGFIRFPLLKALLGLGILISIIPICGFYIETFIKTHHFFANTQNSISFCLFFVFYAFTGYYALAMTAGRYQPNIFTFCRQRRISILITFLLSLLPTFFIKTSIVKDLPLFGTILSLTILGILSYDLLTCPPILKVKFQKKSLLFRFFESDSPFISLSWFTLGIILVFTNFSQSYPISKEFNNIILSLCLLLVEMYWISKILPRKIVSPETRLFSALLLIGLILLGSSIFPIPENSNLLFFSYIINPFYSSLEYTPSTLGNIALLISAILVHFVILFFITLYQAKKASKIK